MSIAHIEPVLPIIDSNNFKKIFKAFPDYVTEDLLFLVCNVIDNGGYVTVDPKIDPKKCLWDGNLTIHFPSSVSAQDVVELLTSCRPDKFGMNDNKTLWMWWD